MVLRLVFARPFSPPVRFRRYLITVQSISIDVHFIFHPSCSLKHCLVSLHPFFHFKSRNQTILHPSCSFNPLFYFIICSLPHSLLLSLPLPLFFPPHLQCVNPAIGSSGAASERHYRRYVYSGSSGFGCLVLMSRHSIRHPRQARGITHCEPEALYGTKPPCQRRRVSFSDRRDLGLQQEPGEVLWLREHRGDSHRRRGHPALTEGGGTLRRGHGEAQGRGAVPRWVTGFRSLFCPLWFLIGGKDSKRLVQHSFSSAVGLPRTHEDCKWTGKRMLCTLRGVIDQLLKVL